MKLKNLLRGHVNDNYVIIENGNQKISWSGKGIFHIVSKYACDWLEKDVSNTTKEHGHTVITLDY